jgi:hypothetical protein
MSHLTLKQGYTELVDRLNRFPQGAPPSDTLYKILQILFSEREAQLVALLPIKPFTAKKAAQIWKMDLTEARNVHWMSFPAGQSWWMWNRMAKPSIRSRRPWPASLNFR